MTQNNTQSRPVDFACLIEQIEAFRSLKQVAEDLGVSRTHLVNLKNGIRKEPSYSLGARIIEYHQQVIVGKFDHIKGRLKGGWQM